VIWRIRERAAFERLRAEGVRVRPLTSAPSAGDAHPRRSLWCSFLSDTNVSGSDLSGTGSAPPRVAFAIGRKVGPAVVRNRLRRQIRAVLHEAHSIEPIPAGDYLFGAHPSVVDLTFPQLRVEVLDLLAGVRSGTRVRKA
jgi:ribonuclease P protein component